MRTTSTASGLDVVTVQARDGAPDALVVLAHGFGAPGTDLVGLAEALVMLEPRLAQVRFVFPAAPLTLGDMGYGDSRAWWMIDFEQIARLRTASPEALREFRKVEPAGMPAARQAVHALVTQLMNETGLPYTKLVLGGFSQGSMITTDVALRLEEAPAGLAVLSGTLLIEDVWRARAAARAGLPVFQSHGRRDEVLPYQAATWLEQLLREAGLAVEFTPFDGGHEIPLPVLRGLAAFLTRVLGVSPR
jgi:phospholipase/carboxylesterase